MSLLLYNVCQILKVIKFTFLIGLQAIPERFHFDGKLDHLMRAMKEVLELAAAPSLNQKQAIMRILQQTTECCLFISKYLQNDFEGAI